MIVVDSSALIALFEQEDDAALYAAALGAASGLSISSVSVLETGMVLRARRGAVAVQRLWAFLEIENDFEIVPFSASHARAALAAFEKYGKGFNPRTKLNLGDCCAYALAAALDAPLLFKGSDFRLTDIQSVL